MRPLFVAFVFATIPVSLTAQLPTTGAEIPSFLSDKTVAWFPLTNDYSDIAADPVSSSPNGSLAFEGNSGLEPFESYLSFSGGYIALGSPEKLKWPNQIPCAFSVWFKPQGTTGDGRLYSSENPECCNSIEFRDEQSTSSYAGVQISLSGAYDIVQVPYQDWSHVVVNSEPYGVDSVQVSVYLNNQLYATRSPVPIDESINQFGYDDMFIGQKASPGWDKWRGDAAHMIWFDQELSPSEIQYLFDGILPNQGCTDASACNYDSEADADDDSCIPSGCMDVEACNFNADAQCEGEACDYTCCPGPGCCGPGTTWDPQLQTCVAETPSPETAENCTLFNLQELSEGYLQLAEQNAAQDTLIITQQAAIDSLNALLNNCTGND